MTLRRFVDRMTHAARRAAILLWLGVMGPYGVASAQVGHDPANSPFKDIRRGAMFRVLEGYFGGSRGNVPVGATNGPTTGVRLEYHATNVLTVATGISYANTTAFFLTAYDSVPRKVGPNNNDIILTDFGAQISLTGGKTWHGFQPYVGAMMGIAFGSSIASDTSGYSFGTKFTYAPEAGLRWYPTRRLSAELGGRLLVYKLSFPLTYRLHVLPINAPLSESTVHPWATFGLAWTF